MSFTFVIFHHGVTRSITEFLFSFGRRLFYYSVRLCVLCGELLTVQRYDTVKGVLSGFDDVGWGWSSNVENCRRFV